MLLGPEDTVPQGNIEWLEKFSLALDDRVSCDTVNCEFAATHYAHVKCCNAPVVYCEPHLHEFYKTAIWMVKNNKSIVCPHCSKVNEPDGWLTRPEKLSLL